MFRKLSFLVLALLISSQTQAAAVAIGNLIFDETAFADELGSVSVANGDEIVRFSVDGGGGFPTNEISLETALTDNDINTGIWCQENRGIPCSIELLFTDNDVYNLPGYDLLLFEQGTLEPLDVIIGMEQLSLQEGDATTNPTINDNNGSAMNLYYIDLADYNVPLGEMISSVTLELGFTSDEFFYSADPMLLVSLNPVPVPSAVWLFGTALIGFVGIARRTKIA